MNPTEVAPTPPAEKVVLRVGWRAALAQLALTGVLVGTMAVLATLFNGSGLVDYRSLLLILGIAVPLVLIFRLPVAAVRATRTTVLNRATLGPTLRWEHVGELSVRWSPFGGRVWVRETGGRLGVLVAPVGAWWYADRAFQRDVQTVHAYAVAHDSPVGPVVQGRRTRSVVAVLLILAGCLGVAGVQAARRGVTWPWQALAVAYPIDACRALDPGPLDQVWPVANRFQANGATHDESYATRSDCQWVADGDHRAAPFESIEVTIVRLKADVFNSPIGNADGWYRSDRGQAREVAELAGVGDDAFTGNATVLRDRAEARIADLVVQVDVSGHGDRIAARDAAVRLVRAIVDQVRLG